MTRRAALAAPAAAWLANAARADAAPAPWSDWRGPQRDGRVPFLPERLPAQLKKLWQVEVSPKGMAGLSATADAVFVADRDPLDAQDEWRRLNAIDGAEVWTRRYPAPHVPPGAPFENLDFGNAPRATPLLAGKHVVCHGAFGQLSCARAADGKLVWERDLRREFGLPELTKWGTCATPLLADGKLLVNPGGRKGGLAALDPATGKTLWTAPADGYGYASFVIAAPGGRKQALGYDATTLGGWDLATGKRLWTVKPPRPNDFNVPTPIVAGAAVLLSTENNGTRLHRFRPDGTLDPQPAATHADLAPDTHSPILVGERLLGVWNELFCLDVRQGLKEVWRAEDPAAGGYATLVWTPTRALLIGQDGRLVLFDPRADKFQPLGTAKTFDDDQGVYAHPAFVGTRMYLRGATGLACYDLAG